MKPTYTARPAPAGTKKKFLRMHMHSLPQAGEYIKATPRNWRSSTSALYAGGDSWDLGCDFDTAMTYASAGWHEGARMVAKGLETLASRGTMPRKQFGVYGSRPHAVRFATGNPACMIRKGKQERPKPALTIAVQIGANGDQSAACMSNYGLALASYIERLTLMGYPVEIIAIDMYLYEFMRFAVTWTVKPMGAPLNYADMAFSIGHPAAMRRISFALAERSTCPDYGSYGGAGDAVASDFEGARNVIILNGMLTANRHSQTPESALQHVEQAITDAMTAQNLV
jgi:hypothetical protein